VDINQRQRPSNRASDAQLREAIRREATQDSSLTPSDVRVTGFERAGGNVVPVISRRGEAERGPADVPGGYREQIRSDAASEFGAVSEEETAVTVDNGEIGVKFSASAEERQRRTQIAERFDEQYPDVNITADDVEPTEDGRYRLDESVSSQIANSRRQFSDEVGGDPVGETGGNAQQQAIQRRRAEIAQEVSEETGQDYDAEDVDVTRTDDGEIQFSVDRRESFDLDFSAGLGGPEDEVEQTIDDAASGYSRRTGELGNQAFATDTENENSAGAIVLRAFGRDQLASQYDQSIRNAGSGLVSGAAAIGNVPGVVGAGLEASEVVASGARQTAGGSGVEFGSDLYDRGTAIGESAYEQARSNPARTAGALGGSLVGSAGAISAASRVSGRAGTAARYAIQPGEELAGSAGFRATRAVSNERTAQRAFPNREPLIVSEEAALQAGQRATDAARRAGSSTASRVAREATALRFRVSEAVRSDAPSRGTNDNLVSQGAQRVREEAVSARFGAAETASELRQRAGNRASEAASGLRERASNARERASDLAGDERGQAQVPRSQSRSRSERRTAEQQLVESNSRLREEASQPAVDRDRASRPELDPNQSSRGVSRTRLRADPRLADTNDSPLGRVEAAQETSVDARSETLGGRVTGRTRLDFRGESRTDTRVDTRLGTRPEAETGSRRELRTAFRAETETRADTRTAFETETRSRRELEGDDFTSNERPSGGLGSDLTAFGSVVERDLLNPFTGE
jgi:hypothetical protein